MSTLIMLLLCLQDQEPPAAPVEKPQAQEKEIIIIGQRRDSDVLDVPSAVTVLTADQIQKSGATNIVDAVRTQPGFFVQGANKGAYDQNVDIRGYNNGAGNGQRTLVLVDGRKTNAVASSSTDWAAIPMENIERIEIVRGPAAALYGDAALAGVVNIITKKGGKEAFSNLTASAGNWNTRRAAVNVGGSQQNVLFDVYAGADATDGWRDNSEYQGQNFTGRVETPLTSSLRGFLKIGHHDDTRERPGTLSKTEIDTLGRNASVTVGDAADRDENYLDVGLTQSLGDLGELSLFINHTRVVENALFVSFGGFETADVAEISMLQLKHVVAPKLFGREATFTTGVDLSYEGANGESGFTGAVPSESTYRRRLMGLYEHVEIRPLSFVILSGGVRYDRALLDLDRNVPPGGFGDTFARERAFDQWSPQAGVTFRVLESVSLYTSWGRTFKYPTRDELVGFTESDPNLDPERAEVYEVGARFWSSSWGSAGLTAYRMVVDDEIYFDPDFAPFGSNQNFDEVTHQGLEGEARVTPWDWLEVFATQTLTRAVITDHPTQEGKHYPVTPRVAGSAGATLKVQGAALTLSGRYAGVRYMINDFDNVEDKLESYWVFDARLAYAWKAVTGFVSVYNVTDREYMDSGGLAFSGPRFNPAPDRSYLIGGEVRF